MPSLTNSKPFSVLNINARSILNKSDDLESVLTVYDPDVTAVTETWLSDEIPDSVAIPSSHEIYRCDRASKGGGVALIIKKGLDYTPLPQHKNIEMACIVLHHPQLNIFIGVFYRPPNSNITVLEAFADHVGVYAKRYTHMVLCGDFNLPRIDWDSMRAVPTCDHSELLLDVVFSCKLGQIVHEPTRVSTNSRSLLDLVFLSESVQRLGFDVNVLPGISDHEIVQFKSHMLPSTSRAIIKPFRDFNSADNESILDFLELDFDTFKSKYNNGYLDVNGLWLHFKTAVHTCINKYVPQKQRKINRQSPWITRDIIHLKRRVKRLSRAPKTPNVLPSLRADLRKKIKESKYHFFNVKMHGFLVTNPKKFWTHITQKKDPVGKIKINDREVSDACSIARAFNAFFSSVFVRATQCCTNFNIPGFDIPDITITEPGIFSALLNLDPKKSAGPDRIPNAFLYRYAEWCSKYLYIIFNESLLSGVVPDDWKTAKVTPVHKSGDKLSVKNYRPISLLCTAGKVLEHFIFKHLVTYLESNMFFTSNQHGFRRGFSTVTQLIHTTNDISKVLDKGGQIDAIFLDFEKAFDRVPHSNLMLKIRNLVKNEKITQWLDSYLSSRYQYVQIGDSASHLSSVVSGVPQGSVLGPLLFIIYLNDLQFDCPVRFRFFADDCVVYLPIESVNDQKVLNKYLTAVSNWCADWNMSLNTTKCRQMTITHKKFPFQYAYQINNVELEVVNEFKYLGVTMTSNLTWNKHIQNITSSALRRLWLLRHRLQHCTSRTKTVAYTTLVRPLLEYADVVWDPHTKTDSAMLERVQKKALRFIHNAYSRRVSVTELRRRSDLPTLESRRKLHRLKILHSIVNGYSKLDFNTYLEFNMSRPTRNKHNKTILMPFTRTNAHRLSFFPRTIAEWNTLPRDVTNLTNQNAFSTAIQNCV